MWIEATSSLHPIRSETAGLEGFIDVDIDGDGRVDVDAEPKGELSFAVDRLTSGNPLEDRELRRRIDSRRFPRIDGRLVELRRTGEAGRYLVRGDLTFRGVTRSYEDELRIDRVDDQTLEVEGESTFDIRDFGMEPPRILIFRVHPEVTVRVAVVAAKEV